MELIKANLGWEKAFHALYEDFVQRDPDNAAYYQEGSEDFARYVKRLEEESEGVNLKPGYVPCSHFWLVEDRVILGVIRIRHHIDNDFLAYEAGHIGYDMSPTYRGHGHGKRMLSMALKEAKLMGLDRVLITADEDNWASRKVIEANEGALDGIVDGKVYKGPIARYWVVTK